MQLLVTVQALLIRGPWGGRARLSVPLFLVLLTSSLRTAAPSAVLQQSAAYQPLNLIEVTQLHHLVGPSGGCLILAGKLLQTNIAGQSALMGHSFMCTSKNISLSSLCGHLSISSCSSTCLTGTITPL